MANAMETMVNQVAAPMTPPGVSATGLLMAPLRGLREGFSGLIGGALKIGLPLLALFSFTPHLVRWVGEKGEAAGLENFHERLTDVAGKPFLEKALVLLGVGAAAGGALGFAKGTAGGVLGSVENPLPGVGGLLPVAALGALAILGGTVAIGAIREHNAGEDVTPSPTPATGGNPPPAPSVSD